MEIKPSLADHPRIYLNSSDSTKLQIKTNISARLTQILLLSLIGLFCWTAIDNIAHQSLIQITVKLAIQTLPLLIFVSGLFKQQTHSAIYLCMVLLVYLMASIVDVSLNVNWVNVAFMTITGLLHLSLLFFLHWKYKILKQQSNN